MKQSKWDIAINDRERRKELEEKLYEINDFILNRYNVSEEEDDIEDERLYIMKKDQEAIIKELESLGSTEERYQEALAERSTEILEQDQDAVTFFKGIELVISELNQKEIILSESIAQARGFQKQFEGIIASLDGADLEAELKAMLIGLSQQIYQSIKNNLAEFSDDVFKNVQVNLSQMSIWEIYTNNDELIINIDEQIQRILAQKIELQLRKEEYVADYDSKEDKSTEDEIN